MKKKTSKDKKNFLENYEKRSEWKQLTRSSKYKYYKAYIKKMYLKSQEFAMLKKTKQIVKYQIFYSIFCLIKTFKSNKLKLR